MEIYPILNKPGKGKYVFIFILNERAVAIHPRMVMCVKSMQKADMRIA